MFPKILVFIVLIAAFFCTLLVNGMPAVSNGNQNPAALCKLPPAKGHCRALIPRWRYNSASGKCQEFHFGGCDGNSNNFESYKACMSVCDGVS